MSILGATFVAIGFAILAHWVGLLSKSREVFEVSRTAAEILGDSSIGDKDKEKLLQNHSLRLFALLGTLLAASASVLARKTMKTNQLLCGRWAIAASRSRWTSIVTCWRPGSRRKLPRQTKSSSEKPRIWNVGVSRS